MKKQAQLGLFILIGLVGIAVSILTIKNISFEKGYRLKVYFNEVSGLVEKSWVRVSGVKIGKVQKISLEGRRAVATIWIKDGVQVHTDAQATIASTGLLGVKFLDLKVGSEEATILKDGEGFEGTDPISLDTMMSTGLNGLSDLSKSLSGLTGEGKLNALIQNATEITEKINKNLDGAKIKEFVDNASELSKNLNQLSRDLSEITSEEKIDIKAMIKNLNAASEKLDRILAKIDSGESAIGRLLSDKEIGDNIKKAVEDLAVTSREAKNTISRFTLFKTYWDYELRYGNDEFKSDFGLQIRPKPEKFYYLGASNISGDSTVSAEKKNTFDLHIGRELKLDDKDFATVYAGIIRSAGGVGLGVKPFWKWSPWDRFRIDVETYDFDRKITATETKPRINVMAGIRPAKWMNIKGGFEDVTAKNEFHTSMNLIIEDEDLAYMLALIGLARP